MRKKVTAKKCQYCGEWFRPTSNQRYCSAKCARRYRSLFDKYVPRNKNTKDTLCWDCKKATGGSDCPWANKFKPVEGWTATPTIVKVAGIREENSFIVHKCPLFEEG